MVTQASAEQIGETMPIYCYSCTWCGEETEAERPVADRHNGPPCPRCGVPLHDIVIFPVRGRMTTTPELTTEAQIIAEKGKDWRETPGSRRMADDIPGKLYSAPGDVTRRHTKRRRG